MGLSFRNPRAIYAYLNECVIGQERAKKTLSVAMFNHSHRIKALDDTVEQNLLKGTSKDPCHILEKSNVLLVGPSGCGKTLLAQHLAKSCNLPFTIADCSCLVESGYIGMHADEIMGDLLAAADNDVEKAQRGVVVLDEIDKLRKASHGRDVGGQGAQQALLKLIEGKQVKAGETFLKSGKLMDTTNVLFIAAGAFCDIHETIHSRMSKEGLEEAVDGKDLLQNLLPIDLITYGMIPELVGRIPVVVNLDPLSIESLKEAITGTKRSILKQYQWLFKSHKVDMTMTPEAIHEVAVQAMKQKTGARGLRAIMEDVLREAMFEVPGSDVQRFVVTAENVRKEQEIQYERRKRKGKKLLGDG